MEHQPFVFVMDFDEEDQAVRDLMARAMSGDQSVEYYVQVCFHEIVY